jgi:hypothetical protein
VTQAIGCAIPRPTPVRTAAGTPTYYRDVLPILQEQCQSCHRPGQIGPFSLTSYTEARNWAQEVKEFTKTRRMPPWKAEPGYGEFDGVRRLSEREIAVLARWADAGAPEGNRRQAPRPKQWPKGWALGQPDLVLSMPEEYAVEATGDDVFRCFVLPSGLTEDRDVVAAEIRPGNPRVVHHVLCFYDTSGAARGLDAKDLGAGYASTPGGIGFIPGGAVGGWAPGNMPRYLPAGVGRRVPKGSDIVMQLHYHKTGKPERDRTTIGLYFAREPVSRYLKVWLVGSPNIDIPPNAARHQVTGELLFPSGGTAPHDGVAINITPHMHLLAKEIKVWASLPDGTTRELIWIRDWDYRSQETYRFKEPVALPKGTKFHLVAYYDNSSGNPLNPSSPPKRVTFGEQTTDEMCFAFLEVVDTSASPKP